MRGYFSAYHLFTDTLDSFKYCKIIRYNDGVMRRNQSTAVARGQLITSATTTFKLT